MKKIISMILASAMMCNLTPGQGNVSVNNTDSKSFSNQGKVSNEIILSVNAMDNYTLAASSLLEDGTYNYEDIDYMSAKIIDERGKEITSVPVGTVITDENLEISITYKDGYTEPFSSEGFLGAYEVKKGLNTITLSLIIDDDNSINFSVGITGTENESKLQVTGIKMNIIDANENVVNRLPVGTVISGSDMIIYKVYEDGTEKKYDGDLNLSEITIRKGRNTVGVTLYIDNNEFSAQTIITGYEDTTTEKKTTEISSSTNSPTTEVVTEKETTSSAKETTTANTETSSKGNNSQESTKTSEITSVSHPSETTNPKETTIKDETTKNETTKQETTKNNTTEKNTSERYTTVPSIKDETTKVTETSLTINETENETLTEKNTTQVKDTTEHKESTAVKETTVAKETTAAQETTTTSKENKKIPAEHLSVSFSSSQIFVGKKIKITAKVSPQNTTDKVKYSSSNNAVATVSSNGIVTGKKAGSVVITVKTTNGIRTKCKITVYENPKWVKLNRTKLTLSKGKKYRLTYTLPKYSMTRLITWSSDNSKVISINKNGEIKAKRSGKAKVTVKTHNGKKASCIVTVK